VRRPGQFIQCPTVLIDLALQRRITTHLYMVDCAYHVDFNKQPRLIFFTESAGGERQVGFKQLLRAVGQLSAMVLAFEDMK
jgi:hypothetical protein